MSASSSIFKELRSLWAHIESKRKKQFKYLLLLIIFTALAEVVSLGAVLPFLGVLVKPEQVYNLPVLQPLIETVGINTPSQLLLPLTIIFILMALVSGTLRLILLWAINTISFGTGADIGIKVYETTLYQNYSVHLTRNSSEIITGGISKAESIIHLALVPSLTMISYGTIFCSILVTLLVIDPIVALGSFGGFGFLYICIMFYFRSQTPKESESIAFHSIKVIKALQEGLGGIREVLMGSHQQTFLETFKRSVIPLRRSQAKIVFISTSPRFIFESLGIVVIATVSYMISQLDGGLMEMLPTLGVLVISAQKLLPVLQGLYSSWTNIKSGQASLEDVLEFLNQPYKKNMRSEVFGKIEFKNEILLKGINFSHTGNKPWILSGINLKIKKGMSLGIIGATGSGKSTLVDLITTLLMPTEGKFRVDGKSLDDQTRRNWQKTIAYVPQNIFLVDSTIYQNIAFGVPGSDIDKQRVKRAASQAQIADVIDKMELGYNTIVGEQGVRLSGGQKQRLGIARALYKKANILIFDEATSALDPVTERAVMKEIGKMELGITLIFIAHKVETLAHCEKVIKMNNGQIDQIGSYTEIVGAQI